MNNAINKTTLENYISKDKLSYANIYDSLCNKSCEIIFASDGGFAVYEKRGDVMAISADNNETAKKVFGIVAQKHYPLVLLHRGDYSETMKKLGYRESLRCYQAVYMSHQPVEYKLNGYEIKNIPMDYYKKVRGLYSLMDNEEYIKKRIKAGMFGAFKGRKLLGIVGTHAEGTIGLLEVDRPYRKEGIGFALEAHMINEQIKKGNIAYCHVSVDNNASLALQRKLGLEISSDIVIWYEK